MRPSAPLTLAACVIGLVVSVVPIFFAGTAVLMVPIAAQTGWSRGDISTFISAGLVGMAVGSMIVGRLINSWGPRRVILCGTVAFPLSLALFSFASTIGAAIALAVLVGLTGAAVSQLSYVTVLPLFFDRRLGMSLGVAMLGMGVGLALVPQLLQYLQHDFDWRTIERLLAGIVFATTAVTAGLFLHEPPGYRPGATAPRARSAADPSNPAAPLSGVTVTQALRSRVFWQLGLATFLATTVIAGLGIHLTSLLTDRGYSTAQAAGIFSIWGAAGALSRVFGGVVLDYFAARWIGALFLAAAAAGAALLAAGAIGVAAICAVIFVATANGLENDLLPYMTRRYFGLRSHGALYGMLGFAFLMGPAAGSILIGRAFDRFGSYGPALWVAVGATLTAAVLLACLGKPSDSVLDQSRDSDPSRIGYPHDPTSFSPRGTSP
jgi:MFS transporter, OFA family, oxalate/formate antiporter